MQRLHLVQTSEVTGLSGKDLVLSSRRNVVLQPADGGSVELGTSAWGEWRVENGRLSLSRTIPPEERCAPWTGTGVPLSSLSSGADTYRWEFTESRASESGSKQFTGGTVADGVLKVTTTTPAQVTDMPAPAFTVCVRVIPQQTLATTGDNKKLLEYGSIQVYVSSLGSLVVHDGSQENVTSVTGMNAAPFHLAITRQTGGALTVYKDGASIFSAVSSTVGTTPALKLHNGNRENWSIWYDDVRVIGAAVTTNITNTLLYGWREMYTQPVTVRYGFRIANDESLELVKMRGSSVVSWSAPATVTGGNAIPGEDGEVAMLLWSG